jgi:hypothetical protein
VAGALLGRLAASVRLAAPVQAEDKPAASAELDRTVHQVFALANQYMRWEFDDLARRLEALTKPGGQPIFPDSSRILLLTRGSSVDAVRSGRAVK